MSKTVLTAWENPTRRSSRKWVWSAVQGDKFQTGDAEDLFDAQAQAETHFGDCTADEWYLTPDGKYKIITHRREKPR